MHSFFTKLYKYRQSELQHQKENFLTEIFAYSLKVDLVFRKEFLVKIGVLLDTVNFSIETQLHDSDFGRPDIFIKIDQIVEIIIECKIGASQEKTQLSRYANLLIKNAAPQKHLIFLTKYFEETEDIKKVNFKHLRWYDIFILTAFSNHPLTQELSNFLKDEKMSTKISFNKEALNTLRDMQVMVRSMNEFLKFIEGSLINLTKAKFRPVNRIEYGDYGIECKCLDGGLWIGFCQYEDDEEMQLCLEFYQISSSKISEKIDKLALSNWVYDSENEGWFIKNGLSYFFKNGEFDSVMAHDFIETEVARLFRVYFKP